MLRCYIVLFVLSYNFREEALFDSQVCFVVILCFSSCHIILGKKRYLILRQGCLYYFKDEVASSPKGSFVLSGYE